MDTAVNTQKFLSLGPDDLRCSLPFLPSEIWNNVFSYLQYTESGMPCSEPWFTYRRINQHVKTIVEELCVQWYLSQSSIVVDNHECFLYQFAGFCCYSDDDLVAFRQEGSQISFKAGLFNLSDIYVKHSYRPGIFMQLGSGATDLLPFDLSFIPNNMTCEAGGMFVFRWRSFFTALFTELKHSASVVQQHQLKKNTHDVYHNSEAKFDRVPSLIEHATSLYIRSQGDKESATPPSTAICIGNEVATIESSSMASTAATISSNISRAGANSLSQPPVTLPASSAFTVFPGTPSHDYLDKGEDDHLLLSPSERINLILRAGTSDVGVDGRYREVRRMRRRRLWLHQTNKNMGGQDRCLCSLEDESEEMRKLRMDFERQDEARVSRRLLALAVEMERRGKRLIW